VQAICAGTVFPACNGRRGFVRNAMADHESDVAVTALSSAATLVEAVGRGSRLALKRLYDLESRRLYGIALRIVRRPEVAADVLQEAFIQVWQNAGSYAPERGALVQAQSRQSSAGVSPINRPVIAALIRRPAAAPETCRR